MKVYKYILESLRKLKLESSCQVVVADKNTFIITYSGVSPNKVARKLLEFVDKSEFLYQEGYAGIVEDLDKNLAVVEISKVD